MQEISKNYMLGSRVSNSRRGGETKMTPECGLIKGMCLSGLHCESFWCLQREVGDMGVTSRNNAGAGSRNNV